MLTLANGALNVAGYQGKHLKMHSTEHYVSIGCIAIAVWIKRTETMILFTSLTFTSGIQYGHKHRPTRVRALLQGNDRIQFRLRLGHSVLAVAGLHVANEDDGEAVVCGR